MWRFFKFVVFSIIIVTLSFGIYKISNRYNLNLIYKNVDWSINTKGLDGAVSFDFDKENNLYIAFKNTIKMINKDNKEKVLVYDRTLNIYDIAAIAKRSALMFLFSFNASKFIILVQYNSQIIKNNGMGLVPSHKI